MFVSGLGTATPPRRYTKAQCWSAFEQSEWFQRLDRRSHAIAASVLLRDNGIDARRLALESLDDVFAIDPDTLQRRFSEHAPTLAAMRQRTRWPTRASTRKTIDGIVVSTCTGYLCPGLTATSSSA